MSHGFRLIALDFTKFIKSIPIGADLPDLKMIDIFNNQIQDVYFPKAVIDQTIQESGEKHLPKSQSDDIQNKIKGEELILPETIIDIDTNQPIDKVDQELNQL